MGSKEEFVDFVKDELSKRNWSHAELARRSGISQAHISRVIKGDYQPGIDLLNSVALVFDVPQEFIFRCAGILPEKKETNPTEEKALHLFSQLNTKDKGLVIDFIQLLIGRKE